MPLRKIKFRPVKVEGGRGVDICGWDRSEILYIDFGKDLPTWQHFCRYVGDPDVRSVRRLKNIPRRRCAIVGCPQYLKRCDYIDDRCGGANH